MPYVLTSGTVAGQHYVPYSGVTARRKRDAKVAVRLNVENGSVLSPTREGVWETVDLLGVLLVLLVRALLSSLLLLEGGFFKGFFLCCLCLLRIMSLHSHGVESQPRDAPADFALE